MDHYTAAVLALFGFWIFLGFIAWLESPRRHKSDEDDPQ